MSRELVLQHGELFPGGSAISRSVAQRGLDRRPVVVLLIGGIATAILATLEAANSGSEASAFEGIHVVVSASAASLALLMLARRPGVTILRYGPLSAAVAATALGMASLDLVPFIGVSAAALMANLCFVAGTAVAMAVLVPILCSRLDRRTGISAGLDAGIMLIAGTTLLLTLWRADIAGSAGPQGLLLPLFAVALAASTFMAAVAALAMRAVPTNRGFWFGLPGVALLGLSWIVWVDLFVHGQTRNTLESLLFSAGILIVSYGWITWDEEIDRTQRYETAARWLTDWVPMASILLCAAIEAVPHSNIDGIDPAPVGTVLLVLLAIVRQRLLVVSERSASSRLAGEFE